MGSNHCRILFGYPGDTVVRTVWAKGSDESSFNKAGSGGEAGKKPS